jgi:N-methylhydantoinase A/oxoprolinase/acetone carboxylase beta subunit
VLVDDNLQVAASVKAPTTKDVHSGIREAVNEVLRNTDIDKRDIKRAMLGTTQCTNAIVERKRLAPVGVLRIAAPAACGIPPMTDWSDDLRRFARVVEMIGGGFEHDGKEIAPFDEAAARNFFEKCKKEGIKSVAISSCFAPVRDDHEIQAEKLAREVMGDDIHVSVSSKIGSMGLIERENATILNAMLYEVSHLFTDGFQSSLREAGITNAECYFSQNDGTLMSTELARKYPILTIACGPTNSIRGASYLSGYKDAVIIDVGGTTTDIGVLQRGFPRESSIAVTIGGVRTNFRMPDVVSFGLGGGSIVREHDDGTVTVGPDSVGYEITKKALCFGGNVLTATDVAVRLGMSDIGDPEKVMHIDKALAEKALSVIVAMVEDHIDEMKISHDAVDVILVGGGSILLPSFLNGVRKVVKPENFAVANAIGAAISKVSGNYEKLISFDQTPREEALAAAKKEAVQLAVDAGARPDTVEIIDMEDVPLQYYPGNTCRVKIKAAGDLA